MLDAGIKTPVPLEELENHLRDEIGEQLRAGLSEAAAFDAATRQIGRPGVLKSEFAKVGGTIFDQLKRILFALAGIPNYQLATNMNTANQNSEPGWATYLKSGALILPAIFCWLGACVFVVPKLKAICAASGMHFPQILLTAESLTDFLCATCS